MNKRVAVFRHEHFNAPHRLYNPDWEDKQNSQVFGKCSNANYHGHNYELIIKVVGEPDPRTGYVMDLKELSDLVNEQVIERFDHKNLNLDTEEFRNLNPTAENIAIVIYGLLRPHINEVLDLQIFICRDMWPQQLVDHYNNIFGGWVQVTELFCIEIEVFMIEPLYNLVIYKV